MAHKPLVGSTVSRVDGILKVMGQARYAGEYDTEGLLYGVVVCAAIAKGRIAALDSSAAMQVPGIIEVITHKNRLDIPWFDEDASGAAATTESPFRVLFDDKIYFSGQPIALVVAESFELARYGATLINVTYTSEPHNTDFSAALSEKFLPEKNRNKSGSRTTRGDAAGAFAAAPVRVNGEYRLAMEHHNPIEMHASTVIWEGDGKVKVYDKNQGSQNAHDLLADAFGFEPGELQVLNPFVGGAFGSGLRPAYQGYLAMLAAKMLRRSVRVTLTRQQMFTHVHRPQCVQSISLAADSAGKLLAIITHATTGSSRFESYTESIVNWGATTYACDNLELEYTIAPLDTPTPGNMRAPGAATGMNLFEIAMDELAYAANIDPLALRIANYSDKDALHDKPYTSKALMAAYREGSTRFGWAARSHAPRSMRNGKELIGWGMATGIWEALMMKATARATIDAGGNLQIASAASDIGTGTYTIMAQIAADAMGLPLTRIEVRLGDSDLPYSPLEGGSFMAASVGAAVRQACDALGRKLLRVVNDVRPELLGGAKGDEVEFVEGYVRVAADPSRRVSYEDIVAMSGARTIEAEETVKPEPADHRTKSRNTHSAAFAEVRVDEDLGIARVTRIVVAVAAGRIINPMTARSQILGGAVMAVGMALHEEALTDHRIGRIMNHNLAEYHIPVHADIGDIDVIFVDEPDAEISPLGVKGVGEIGIVGTAAAIANAIFHATGKRVRDLPITIDKLIG